MVVELVGSGVSGRRSIGVHASIAEIVKFNINTKDTDWDHLFYIRLRGCNPGNRYAVRTARYKPQANMMAVLHRTRVATVFSADAVFDAFLSGVGILDGHFHQFADSALVERHERIVFDEFLGEVLGNELGSIVARKAEIGRA